MMFTSACDVRDIPRPNIGQISRKKHQLAKEDDDQDNTMLGRGKKVRKNNSGFETGSSSSNKSDFKIVPVVLASNQDRDVQLRDMKNNQQRHGDSNLQDQSRCNITLTLTNSSYKSSRQGLSLKYMRRNGLTKPRLIGLLGKNGMKIMVSLLQDKTGRMNLGGGWRDFVLANGLEVGDSFTLESIWEDSTPMLRLLSTDPECDQRRKYCSQACEEECVYIEPSNGNSAKENEKNVEQREYPFSEITNRVVFTLTLTPQDVQKCQIILPDRFMRAYGMDMLRKISILGKANMKWWGYRWSKDGTIAVGIGWSNFCKSNGIEIGDSFILEFIYKDVDETPVFNLCPKSI